MKNFTCMHVLLTSTSKKWPSFTFISLLRDLRSRLESSRIKINQNRKYKHQNKQFESKKTKMNNLKV